MKESCSYCGDPATGTCKRKHLEWIIVLPEQIKPGDVWRHPFRGPHGVMKVLKRGDTVVVKTGQQRTFVIPFLNLPELVKRLVPCGWPTCELHCGKCLLYRESENRRADLMGR